MPDDDFLGHVALITLESEERKKSTLRANAERASQAALAAARKKTGRR